MAFDDLPFGAHDLLIELLEAHTSGNYNPVFYAASTDTGGWSIRLEGVNANEDKELSGFSEGDLLDLEINRYLTVVSHP